MKALLVGKEPGFSLGYTYDQTPPYDAVVIGSLTLGQMLSFSPLPIWKRGSREFACALNAALSLPVILLFLQSSLRFHAQPCLCG